MTWLLDLRRFARPLPDQIGPGRLILVTGPSGAGKDTLIDGARRACADDPTVVFCRRIVTRPPSASEDNTAVSDAEFARLTADGAFALSWEAHGHRYGIPSSIDDEVRAGRTIVCNASRGILGYARRRYAFLTAVLVTAPPQVLEARLAGRRRPSDGPLEKRLARAMSPHADADVVIRNVGNPEVGVRRLLNVIQDNYYFFAT